MVRCGRVDEEPAGPKPRARARRARLVALIVVVYRVHIRSPAGPQGSGGSFNGARCHYSNTYNLGTAKFRGRP